MQEKQIILYLSKFDGFGIQKIKRIREKLGDLVKWWNECKYEDLIMIGIGEVEANKFFEWKRGFNPEQEENNISAKGINYLCYLDKEYSVLLGEIYSPPPILYYRGDVSLLSQVAVGVVGTRKMTDYGKSVTGKIVEELVGFGLVIVSGLALGVDSEAHWATVRAKGKTIAVLPGGLDQIYPSSNIYLSKQIVDTGGLLVSECSPGVRPMTYHFPARNRIVSGVSKGVLVTEAPKKSGALITAMMALEQNRLVWAIPGSIWSENSGGCHELLRQGATLVDNAKVIVDDLGIAKEMVLFDLPKKIEFENDLQKMIYEAMRDGEKYIDELVILLNVDSASIGSALMMMSIAGLVTESGNGKWVRL